MRTYNPGRRNFLKAASLVIASLVFKGSMNASAQRAEMDSVNKPNIIYIMVDDMGWADLGCYGSQQIKTPNIDQMASEGIRFTQAYSGCTVCAPARSVLMTGLHTGHTSVRGNTGGIPLQDSDVTVAEVLKQAGYATGCFGKWGLGDAGTDGVAEKQGFDEFFGYYHQVHAHDYWTDYLWHNGRKAPMTGEKESPERYTHYRIFERMKDFILRNKNKPFFCYAPWTPPHGKYQIPESDPAWQLYKDQAWDKRAKVVAAMDTMIDRHVGEVLDLLKNLRIDRRTIVFFGSDNGAAYRFDGILNSSGPLRGAKKTMYEGGIRVPMIAYWPGKIEAGTVSEHVCYFADMMPTLAELAGASRYVPANVDGLSIVPTLMGQNAAQAKHPFLYWEWQLYDWNKRQDVPNALMQAVRMDKWKAVRHKSNVPFELYDLSQDIGEKNNIASEHPEIIAQIEAYIRRDRTEPRAQLEPDLPDGKRFR
ncbi:MAG: arylsulfatase [Sedimentisphaerales bacterium]|nr:arylsulfatase [Sedimentisphaerales bacterium]